MQRGYRLPLYYSTEMPIVAQIAPDSLMLKLSTPCCDQGDQNAEMCTRAEDDEFWVGDHRTEFGHCADDEENERIISSAIEVAL